MNLLKISKEYLNAISQDQKENVIRAPKLNLALSDVGDSNLELISSQLIMELKLFKKSTEALKVILLNIKLYSAFKYIGVSYNDKDYIGHAPVNAKAIRKIVSKLRLAGYLGELKGNQALKLTSRIEPLLRMRLLIKLIITPAYPMDEVIIRDEDKNDFIYESTPQIKEIKSNLIIINQNLQIHKITKEGEYIYPFLRRIFNLNFESGGRFYSSAYQNLRKEKRCDLILINGEKVIEIDYCQIQANLAWIKTTGKICPFDAYSSPRGSSLTRDEVKIIWACLINCKSINSAAKAASRKLFEKHLEMFPQTNHETQKVSKNHYLTQTRVCIAHLKAIHSPIANYFASGAGVILQFLESRICEQILLSAANSKLCLLPIHDSFITPISKSAEVQKILEVASLNIVGNILPFKIKK